MWPDAPVRQLRHQPILRHLLGHLPSVPHLELRFDELRRSHQSVRPDALLRQLRHQSILRYVLGNLPGLLHADVRTHELRDDRQRMRAVRQLRKLWTPSSSRDVTCQACTPGVCGATSGCSVVDTCTNATIPCCSASEVCYENACCAPECPSGATGEVTVCGQILNCGSGSSSGSPM